MNSLDLVVREDIVSTVGGREVIDVDELLDMLNILVGAINQLQDNWEDLSESLRRIAA